MWRSAWDKTQSCHYFGLGAILPPCRSRKLLPPYIIKCSHGSGWNIVVRGNDRLDCAAICTQLGGWLATDYGVQCCEPGYSAVPRRLLVEPLLTNRGGFPIEYMFFMFNGVARLVLVRANYGDLHHQRIHSYYDMKWRQLQLRTSDMPNAKPVLRPPELDTMRVMAERLAEHRDHLRVDFLVSDRRVYVGELTCYHRSGIFRFEPDSEDFCWVNAGSSDDPCCEHCGLSSHAIGASHALTRGAPRQNHSGAPRLSGANHDGESNSI